MQRADRIYQYWGKTSKDCEPRYHLLAYHSLDVAAVGNRILFHHPILVSRISSALNINQDQVIPFISFLLAIHDLGKFSESFQGMVKDLFLEMHGREPRLCNQLHHSNLGIKIFENILDTSDLNLTDRLCDADLYEFYLGYKFCLNASFGHHGMPPDMGKINYTSLHLVCTDDDISAASDFLQESANLFLHDLNSKIPIPDCDTVSAQISWLIAGLVIISDWIGSSGFFPFHNEKMPLEVYWKQSLDIADRALPICGLSDYTVNPGTGIRSLFPSFSAGGRTPSPLQEAVSTLELGTGPHLFIIEESTGGGKTEAAVTLAHRLMAEGYGEGIYVGLPTMATANAMYERMKDCYQRLYCPGKNRPSLILAHGSRHLSDSFLQTIGPPDVPSTGMDYLQGEESGEAVCARWLADHKKSSLLASIGVGTIDQGLTGVLPVKHQSLRLFGIARNILIVDEVHAYDRFMNRLLRSLLTFHAALGGSAILLSATLPKSQKEEYIFGFTNGVGYAPKLDFVSDYPLITHVYSGESEQIPVLCRPGTERDVEVTFFHSTEAVTKYLEEELKSGKCACWIRNTVSDAVLAYQMMAEKSIASKLLLFHARFAMGDRLEREREVLTQFGTQSRDEDRRGVLLIATQVVEQSLDIDFDVMVTDLAPIDLVIQRAGRLHRHNRGMRDKPILGIYSPPFDDNPKDSWYSELFPGGAYVYQYHGLLWKTAELLRSEGSIRIPDRSRFLIESVYDFRLPPYVPSALTERDKMTENNDRRAEGLAGNRSLKASLGYILVSGLWGEDDVDKTRLADPTIQVLLCRWDPVHNVLSLWRDMDQYSIDMSRITVSQRTFDVRVNVDPLIESEMERLSTILPDGGKRDRIIPLIPINDYYYCPVIHSNGQQMIIEYDSKKGMIIRSDSNVYGG
ncbi:MAG: CRISPR-associated helicase Cas3' [Methanospirillum sp.]|jgi:CRISPR-associated endonuclease/helicase Cas3|nr:CRISPR-associated helicase Cas3' [Methanospirillum sp.]